MRLGEGSAYTQRLEMSWQKRALEHIDLIPECNYASRFYARMLKQLVIYPALIDVRGNITPITEGRPVELIDRIQDPGGGRSQLLGNYGRLMFTTGEGCLFGRDLETDEEMWSFVWNEELKVEYNADNSIRKITWTPGKDEDKKEYGPDDAIVYRFWTPHPRKSGEADSPMRAGSEVAEELIILTKSVRATAVTRMTSGMFKLPEEISFAPAEPIGDEDPLNDPLFEDLANHFEAQVEDAGSAKARTPFILRGASDYLRNVEWMPLHDPQNDYLERELRKEAVERLARGFDFPPEVLLGLSDANHWAARQILDDMWRSHGAPMAEQFCDDLNEAYLRPTLRDDGFSNWNRVVIAYDESQVVIKPDRAADALKAHAEGVIGDEALREALGFDEEAAQDEEERRIWLAIKLRRPEIAGMRDQSRPNVEEGPPEPGPEGDSGRQTRVVATAARELGAAEMALMRCRELAGARLRTRKDNCDGCTEVIDGLPNHLVASALGEKNVKHLKIDTLSLVQGGTDSFRTMLSEYGYSEGQANDLCTWIELYAASTLFSESTPSLPLGFMAQIEQMKEHALLSGGESHSVRD